MASAWNSSSQSPRYPNVAFYEDKIPAAPNKEFIEDILNDWEKNFEKLEWNHQYIQWLFPNREPGLNIHAFPLRTEEAKTIRETPELRSRVKRAFRMMLDFYGMRLTSDNKFELTTISVERLRILNKQYNHNFQRITRILKSLKEFGYHSLMLPWLKCLADLVYKENKLNHAELSFQKFWLETLDAEDQLILRSYVNRLLESQPYKDRSYSTTGVSTSKTTSTTTATTTATNTKARSSSSTPSITQYSYSTNKHSGTKETVSITDTSVTTMTKTDPGTVKVTPTETRKKSQTVDVTPTETNSVPPRVPPRNSKIIAFYRNHSPIKPNGEFFNDILSWKGDYEKLMKNTYYIFWLFPTSEPGSEQSHVVLTEADAKVIREAPELQGRLMKAFGMMLDFYGMKLNRDYRFEMKDQERVKKLDNKDNHHLKHITRILSALNNLGLKDLVIPWLKFLVDLIYDCKVIKNAHSSVDYWMNSLDGKQCARISDYIQSKQQRYY